MPATTGQDGPASPATMSTTVAISLPEDELAELDELSRGHGVSRTDAVREAVRWYARWGEKLPLEDPTEDDSER